jgi:hypothetical protein
MKCVTNNTVVRHDNVLAEDPISAGQKHWTKSKEGVLEEASHHASYHLSKRLASF